MSNPRLLFVCPCEIHITGEPKEAKADMQTHRENCETCKKTRFVNRIDLIGRFLVKRECVLTRDEESSVISFIVLFEGIVPPGQVVRQMVSGELPLDQEHPELRRLPAW